MPRQLNLTGRSHSQAPRFFKVTNDLHNFCNDFLTLNPPLQNPKGETNENRKQTN